MSFQNLHFLHGPYVVELDEMVAGRGQEPVPVLVPPHRRDRRLVGVATQDTDVRTF